MSVSIVKWIHYTLICAIMLHLKHVKNTQTRLDCCLWSNKYVETFDKHFSVQYTWKTIEEYVVSVVWWHCTVYRTVQRCCTPHIIASPPEADIGQRWMVDWQLGFLSELFFYCWLNRWWFPIELMKCCHFLVMLWPS